jgi:hypothetical protein
MGLGSLVNGPEVVRRVLLTSPFLSWHGLFTEPRFYGPLVHGAETSMVYFAGCLAGAYMMLRGRDMG